MSHIEVVNYDKEWMTLFEIEKALLCSMLPIGRKAIHPIGSTSVPNLKAKPIIDILIEVNDINWLDQFNPVFERNGYECLGEFGLAERRYYRKGKEKRTHQIHAFKKDSHSALRHIAFRDYLKAFPDIAGQYSKLKTDVAKECEGDIEKYCDGKDSFVKEHERKALSWFKNCQKINRIQ